MLDHVSGAKDDKVKIFTLDTVDGRYTPFDSPMEAKHKAVAINRQLNCERVVACIQTEGSFVCL